MSIPRLAPEIVASDLARRFRSLTTRLALAGREVELVHPESPEDLIDEKEFERDERLPYWADLWPSARVLAEVVSRMSGRGKTLVELGCGSGLVAVAAALAGFKVLATDYYDDALQFTRVNVWRNAGVDPATRLVDWRRLPTDLGRHDVVVASDVLYERDYAQLVSDAIEACLAMHDGIALVADPGRLGVDEFRGRMQKKGLALKSAEPVPYVDGSVRQTITVHAFERVVTHRTVRGGRPS